MSTMSKTRPFRVLGLQQIAVGSTDKAALRRLWIDLLGLTPAGTYQSASENVDEDIARAGSGPLAVEVDLMQPIDPEKRPRVHDPALNQVGLWVDDLRAASLARAAGHAFTPGGIRKGAPPARRLLHPSRGSPESPASGEGVLIELVQAPPG
jgi:lactoylglutathione lyase